MSEEKEKIQPDYEAKKAAYEEKPEKRKKKSDGFALSSVLDSWHTALKVIFIVIGTPVAGVVAAFLGAFVSGITEAIAVGDMKESIKDPAYEEVREKYDGIVGKESALKGKIDSLTEEIKRAKTELG